MPTKKQFADALRNAKLSEPQRKALQEVYLQPNHKCTSPKLAKLLGYKKFIAANGVFGKASRAIGEYLGIEPEGGWFSVISSWDRIARTWTLHANFAAAMKEYLKSNDLRPQVDPDEIDLVSAVGQVSANSRREFLVYRNSDKMGHLLPRGTNFSIVTNKPLAKDAKGARIWLIAGTDSPKQYILHCWFIADTVEENSGENYRYTVSGSKGKEFSPPIPLNNLSWFKDFQKSQGNFGFGLNPIEEQFVPALCLLDDGDQAVQEKNDSLLVSTAGRVLTMIDRIKRDTVLVGKIKKLHDYKCQICSHKIELADGDSYAEVHHIQPLGGEHNGPDVMENMLCVCPNHHVQLDYCAIKLDLSQLRILPGHSVATHFVEYHNERVQG